MRVKRLGLSRSELDKGKLRADGLVVLSECQGNLLVVHTECAWGDSLARLDCLCRTPTALDAWLYALLSIVLELKGRDAEVLRDRLDRCPALLAWVKEKRP